MSAGSVRREGSSWTYTIDVPSPDGRRKQMRRRGFATKKAAQAALAEVVAGIASRTFVTPSRLTFGAFLQHRWLPALEHQLKPTTVVGYKTMTAHLVRALGNVALEDLDAATLTVLYGELLRSGLSPRTVRYVHTTAHRALADARRWRLVARNAAEDADPPRQDAPRPKAWTPEHVRRFLAVSGSDRWASLWRLAATSGMRRGELVGLRWCDIDLDAAALTVNRNLVVVAGRAVEGEPKTDRSRRRLTLDHATVDALRAWKRTQAEERLLMGRHWQGEDRVFTWGDGSLLHPDVVSKTFARIVRRFDLPKLNFHGLRHSWATAALVAGVPVKVVADRLGHSSVQITLDVYTASVPGLDEAAANTVAALFDQARDLSSPGTRVPVWLR
jgi:integrase